MEHYVCHDVIRYTLYIIQQKPYTDTSSLKFYREHHVVRIFGYKDYKKSNEILIYKNVQ